MPATPDDSATPSLDEDRLATLLYDAMRDIASRHLRRDRGRLDMSTADLAHEAYLRLARRNLTFRSPDVYRLHAARTMRRVLIDLARKRRTHKRGAEPVRVSLDVEAFVDGRDFEELLLIDRALDRLAEQDPRAADVVVMRFFGGFDQEEIGAALGVTSRTVRNLYTFARAVLRRDLDPH